MDRAQGFLPSNLAPTVTAPIALGGGHFIDYCLDGWHHNVSLKDQVSKDMYFPHIFSSW
jgi:hypothetical protein